VSLGASCDTCDSGDVRSGRLVSYALDGSDAQTVATGLRDGADFAWHPQTGELWSADGGRVVPGVGLDGPPDELDRVKTRSRLRLPVLHRGSRSVLGPHAARK